MIRNHIILFFFLLIFSCGGGTATKAEIPEGARRDAIEARLINELSPDKSRAGRERNQLINYAIDELWDVEPAAEGYFYEITKVGDGYPAMEWDAVKLHYQGRFLDGTVFDDSRRRGQPLAFRVGQMIPAWNLALQKLKSGGKLRLLVPSELAYGAEGLLAPNGDTIIGAHRALIFELEDMEIVSRAEEE